jgi:hypothetical protein
MDINQNQDIPADLPKKQPKLSGPVLAVLVAVGAALAGVVAFTVTKSFVGPGSLSTCEVAQQEVRDLKTQKPNPDDLNAVDDRILMAAAEKLHANCVYNVVIDFETAEVFPWLGVDPQASPNDMGSGVPTDGTAPASQDQATPTTTVG